MQVLAEIWIRTQRTAVGLVGVCPKIIYVSRNLLGSSPAPGSALQIHLVAPALPRLVVITTTPFAASVPYSVAADGPFTISMFSMSSGLMSPKRLKFAP